MELQIRAIQDAGLVGRTADVAREDYSIGVSDFVRLQMLADLDAVLVLACELDVLVQLLAQSMKLASLIVLLQQHLAQCVALHKKAMQHALMVVALCCCLAALYEGHLRAMELAVLVEPLRRQPADGAVVGARGLEGEVDAIRLPVNTLLKLPGAAVGALLEETGIKGPFARERLLADIALARAVAAQLKAQLVHLEGRVGLGSAWAHLLGKERHLSCLRLHADVALRHFHWGGNRLCDGLHDVWLVLQISWRVKAM